VKNANKTSHLAVKQDQEFFQKALLQNNDHGVAMQRVVKVSWDIKTF
jgi:hypothetical protein